MHLNYSWFISLTLFYPEGGNTDPPGCKICSCCSGSDGGQHDADKGCKPGLVCGSNNCRKFGLYYHEKDDCCEKPSSSPTVPPLNIEDSSRNLPLLQNKTNNIVKIETRRCQGRNVDQGQAMTSILQVWPNQIKCDQSVWYPG